MCIRFGNLIVYFLTDFASELTPRSRTPFLQSQHPLPYFAEIYRFRQTEMTGVNGSHILNCHHDRIWVLAVLATGWRHCCWSCMASAPTAWHWSSSHHTEWGFCWRGVSPIHRSHVWCLFAFMNFTWYDCEISILYFTVALPLLNTYGVGACTHVLIADR